MNLQNGYKVIYEKAADGKRTFYASKSNVYPAAEDVELASFNDADFAGKVIYERAGKFYVSNGKVPEYDENGNPMDTLIEGFDEIFVDLENSESVSKIVGPFAESITANGDSYCTPVIDNDTVTIKAAGTVKWLKSTTGKYGNWVGFRINVPEGIDATNVIYTRPNGKSSKLSEVLDAGKNYASVYSDMSKCKTATYHLDWNSDGVNDLTVCIDVTEATLESDPEKATAE